MLKITNTQSGVQEPLHGNVRLYVCGMTVYDRCHLGHARSAVVFDILRNYLEYKGTTVCFIKNFTDIDDKIIHRAAREGCDVKEIADRYITAYEEDMNRMGVRPPTLAPKATEHIPEMMTIIADLLDKGAAYTVSGNVYFDVTRFSAYGQLSGQNMDQLIAGGGGRVENDPGKKNPFDFALWKAAQPLEPSWDAPWGRGRPGWHIECSAMALKHLGPTIDLHGGGSDLIFPHHENELAQSQAHTGQPLARCWMHHGHVTRNREKMSKSLGNFFTLQEIFENPLPPAVVSEVIRFYLLSTHYRSAIDFSDAALAEAKSGLDHFYTLFQKLDERLQAPNALSVDPSYKNETLLHGQAEFEGAMDDDLNTPKAIGVLHEMRSAVNTALGSLTAASPDPRHDPVVQEYAHQSKALVTRLGKTLGLFQVPPSLWSFQAWSGNLTRSSLTNEAILELVREREEARKKRDWLQSDVIRMKLHENGVILEDCADGTTRVKR